MKNMQLNHEFDRPGLVFWNGTLQYKNTDNIQQMLDDGNVPVVGPVRKIFTRTT